MPKTAMSALLAILLLSALSVVGHAQTGPTQTFSPPTAGWNNSGQWMAPTMTPRTLNPDELWRFRFGTRAGYQWLNYVADFKYPSNPDPALQRFAFERMRLELRDSDFWVGFVNAEIQPMQNLVFYGIWGGNAPKEFSGIRMDATGAWTRPFESANGANSVSPWYWDTRFQWWTLDLGAVYWFSDIVALDMGFRSEHIDFQMRAPRNETLEVRGGVPEPNGFALN